MATVLRYRNLGGALALSLMLLLAGCAHRAAKSQAAAPPIAENSSPGSQDLQESQKSEKPEKHEKAQTSPQEADQLFHEMNSILQFVSDDTKLPIEHEVKHKLVSRDEVQKDTEERMKKDKDTKRLEKAEIVLKKFGLVPRDFDLKTYLVSLLKEQVAGFYSTRDKTMYLLNWIPPDQQLEIMSHELTHALQDQKVDLDKWLQGDSEITAAEKADDKKKVDPDDDPDLQIRQDEETTARQAVAEGQGMIVMMDYLLKDSGRTAIQRPDLVESMKEGMMDGGNFPVFKNAPMYLQESLAFPYTYGLDFIENVLIKGGKKQAYTGVLENPPVDTREVMEPKAYLSGEVQQPLSFPSLKNEIGDKYEPYDSGSIGEFDVMVMLKQFSGESTSDRLYPQWRGGGYWAFKMKDARQGNTAASPTQSIALLYLSRWATPQAAQRFAREYAHALTKRYKSVESAEPADNATVVPTRWNTEEGTVSIETNDNMVLALESFDPETLDKVRAKIWDFEKSAPASLSAAAH